MVQFQIAGIIKRAITALALHPLSSQKKAVHFLPAHRLTGHIDPFLGAKARGCFLPFVCAFGRDGLKNNLPAAALRLSLPFDPFLRLQELSGKPILDQPTSLVPKASPYPLPS